MRRRHLIGLRRAEDGEVKGYSNTLGRMPRTHPQQIALDAVFDQGKQLGAVVVQGKRLCNEVGGEIRDVKRPDLWLVSSGQPGTAGADRGPMNGLCR